MKRAVILSLLFCSALFVATGCEKEDQMVSKDSLPKEAKTFLSTYFADYEIVTVTKEFGKFRADGYNVFLKPSGIIEFDRHGSWESVEIDNFIIAEGIISVIPEEIIPDATLAYVKSTFVDNIIVGISKERYGYNIELRNGLEISFNTDGTFRSEIFYDE